MTDPAQNGISMDLEVLLIKGAASDLEKLPTMLGGGESVPMGRFFKLNADPEVVMGTLRESFDPKNVSRHDNRIIINQLLKAGPGR